MGVIPTLFILGVDGTPTLWPMGTGASGPRAIQATVGPGARLELDWDNAGHLRETRSLIPPRPVTTRLEYVWRDGELDRIREFDPRLVEELGDQPRTEQIWTWAGGRPVEVRNVSPEDDELITRQEWTWSSDGTSLTIVESSDHVLARFDVRLDSARRVLHIERAYTIDGSRELIDLTWSDDGRLLEARTRTGSGPELAIGFRWDDRGRLVAQTRSDMPGIDVYQYEYDDA